MNNGKKEKKKKKQTISVFECEETKKNVFKYL